jgi:hypothetical protein
MPEESPTLGDKYTKLQATVLTQATKEKRKWERKSIVD